MVLAGVDDGSVYCSDLYSKTENAKGSVELIAGSREFALYCLWKDSLNLAFMTGKAECEENAANNMMRIFS